LKSLKVWAECGNRGHEVWLEVCVIGATLVCGVYTSGVT